MLTTPYLSLLLCCSSMAWRTRCTRSHVRMAYAIAFQVISSLRTPKSSEGYRAIGGGSPLRRITLEQADALQEALAVRGQPASVYVAMRYWKPFTEDAVAQVGCFGPARSYALQLKQC
jgi:protoheme ferro-lyase